MSLSGAEIEFMSLDSECMLVIRVTDIIAR